jgi:hypothetical protein
MAERAKPVCSEKIGSRKIAPSSSSRHDDEHGGKVCARGVA